LHALCNACSCRRWPPEEHTSSAATCEPTSPSRTSVCATLLEDDRNCSREQLDVAPKRPVGDVEVVQRHHFGEGDLASSEHLPEPCDPGSESEATAVPSDDVLVLIEDQRAWADQAHLVAEHVEQLRQLVQRPRAQESAERRDSGVGL